MYATLEKRIGKRRMRALKKEAAKIHNRLEEQKAFEDWVCLCVDKHIEALERIYTDKSTE